jgi:hypothetical protein
MTTQITLRLPADAKAFVVAQAARNSSSQNSEIIRCIRDRMERVAATGAEIGVLSPVAAENHNTRKECCDAADR